MSSHHYEVDSDDGRTVVFTCPVEGCGRRIVLARGARRPTVIDAGDFFAMHDGAVGPLSLGLRLEG